MHQRAFTLIELSIVLVIIGLIVGGVLVGRDLIEAAKIRSQITQVEQITTAAHTFRVKYNCMPGDCANATQFGLGGSANQNGNGDQMIDIRCVQRSIYSSNNYSKDSNNFYLHLANAGLVEGTFEGYQGEPHNTAMTEAMVEARYLKAKYTNGYVFPSRFSTEVSLCAGAPYNTFLREGGNGFAITAYTGTFDALIPAAQIRIMDEKVDDGLPLSGNVGLGHNGNGFVNNVQAMGSSTGCLPATYQAIAATGTCALMKAVFLNRY